ncbi:HAD family hydrolase [Pseudomonas putida]|uniref:phosphoglycolate phosphatase n=1 Tax=Pseudomonas putida TaxID=303 RepID=A0A6I6XDZ2_PSEPU|nr:HAD hydrolase-like protein [Pseudomonas putida]QHG63842.1 HAD family hydrolase [Pseudomonas putida]
MTSFKFDLSNYSTLVFDCDGVVLNSNKVKTQAFYQAALPYGKQAAEALAKYHVENGGISRYKKFSYFLEHIIPQQTNEGLIDTLLSVYANHVQEGLLSCEIAPGIYDLRQETEHAKWLIVSGGDENELRSIFEIRNISSMFDGGIFGSPDTKEHILSREQSNGNISPSSLFLGDSKYDHQAATGANMDFIFLNKWSEVNNWQQWCEDKKIRHSSDLSSLTSPSCS